MDPEANPNLNLEKVVSNDALTPSLKSKQSRAESLRKVQSKAEEPPPLPQTVTTTQSEQQPRKASSELASTSDLEKGDVEEKKDAPAMGAGEDEPEYPTNKKLIPIIISLYLAFFLVALDRTIIATAIPTITDDFHSLGDVGWYGSAYMLTTCAFMLMFGRLYTFYSPKVVFLTAIGLFEVGSAVCGAAPNSNAFIIGRAIAGLGCAGSFGGGIIIIIYTVPLHKRPIFQGMIGSIFGIASVAGPLLGGVFTSKVSWRWCFYINLPIGGVAMVVLFFILHLPPPRNANATLKEQFWQLDPYGTAVFLPGVICLLLALQWGGTTYDWSNARIVVLLIIAGMLLISFVAIQFWKKEMATVPPRIAGQRSVAAGMWLQFCSGGSFMVVVYYIPIWFQAIKDVSAVKSGIMNLPLILSLVVASITIGIAVNRIGYYTPFVIASPIILAIGAGLLTTFTPFTPHPKWIGYQVVYGFGLGMGMQQATLAAQTCLPQKDAPTGVNLIMFMMQLGGSVFVSVAQNIFTNELGKGVSGIAGLSPKLVVNTGATEIRNVVDPQFIPTILSAYNGALTRCFYAAVALAVAGWFGAIFVEWKSVRKDVDKKKNEEKAEKKKEAAEVKAKSSSEGGSVVEESKKGSEEVGASK